MRYFGIGLPKTGVECLSVAFTMWGLRTQHVVLEGYDSTDAFTDTPCYCDYRELDRRFPGSKFILTLRDPSEWVEAIASGFAQDFDKIAACTSPKALGARRGQDWQCFRQKFGTAPFDREHFRKVYSDHLREATEYFVGRKDDFLALDTSWPDAWQKLVSFMGSEPITLPRLSFVQDGAVNGLSGRKGCGCKEGKCPQ
jgi:hypothetical protein